MPGLAVHESNVFQYKFPVSIQATDSVLPIYTLEFVILKMSPGDSDILTGLGTVHMGHRNGVGNQNGGQPKSSSGMKIRRKQRRQLNWGWGWGGVGLTNKREMGIRDSSQRSQ